MNQNSNPTTTEHCDWIAKQSRKHRCRSVVESGNMYNALHTANLFCALILRHRILWLLFVIRNQWFVCSNNDNSNNNNNSVNSNAEKLLRAHEKRTRQREMKKGREREKEREGRTKTKRNARKLNQSECECECIWALHCNNQEFAP